MESIKFISLWQHNDRSNLEYNLNYWMAAHIIHSVQVWNTEGLWCASVLYSYKERDKQEEKLEHLKNFAIKEDLQNK